MAHGEVYVAQTTPAHINHFYRAVMEANEYPGPAVHGRLHAVPARARHRRRRGRRAGAAGRRLARLPALHLRPAPRRRPSPSGCHLQGNPALRRTGRPAPDGAAIDFLAFARTEGRFAPHFAADGTPSAEILATQADRLANWRTLQELAGIR